ncbi:MAG: winged helix DNA-binding domain-containing protein [Micromonosporaceae bacterium]|nr:winged helix DNA-binding domain-containing protein [Micromonosporaceae bacterium]
MARMILDRRTLNRALLERQLLLQRRPVPVLDAVAHLVGLQAQAPTPPYFGLWSRLAGFDPAELGRLLVDRRVVRAPLMRATIHLVAAGDCRPLRRLLQPIFDRALVSNPDRSPALAGIDQPRLAAATGDLLAEQPRTSKALGAQLAQRWPDRDPAALAHGAQQLVALVQVPPRGVWGAAGQPTWTTVDSWLETPPQPAPALAAEELVRRYLAAFGPAAVADAQHWSGLTGLGEVVERMDLRSYQDEPGRVLFDLPEATLPDPDTPAPVRFVAPFDNLVIGHADRTRVITDNHRRRVFTTNGIVKGTVLVDGFVAGCWRLDQRRSEATLTVEPFVPLSPVDRAAVESEGAGLLGFAAPPGAAHQLRFTA